MRKDYFISSVRNEIIRQNPNQDSNKLTHPKIVEAEIAKAYSELIKAYFMQDAALMDVDSEYFCKAYTANVVQDSFGNWYSSLTEYPLPLKNNLGLRSIRPLNGNVSFVRTSESQLETFRSLYAYKALKKAYYYLSGTKIMYDFPVPEHTFIDQVTIKIIPGFMAFADSDNIEFPYKDETVVGLILQTMGIRPTDNVNDNVR